MRIAIMSFAHLHADSYLQLLQTSPHVEFIGIADDDQARGQHFADHYGVPRFDSYNALLAEQPHGVIVCSENSRHRSLVEQAAEAGAHILCEKPLATSLEDADAILAACDSAGVNLMMAFPVRFSAPVIQIKRMIEAGELGHILGCNTTNQGSLPLYHIGEQQHFRGWFIDKHLAGGGALMDHIVHIADLLRWYLGAEVVEIYAEMNQILHASAVDLETGGLVMLTFDNGTFATIDCSWSKPAYYPTWGNVNLSIVGENGLVTIDVFRQALTVYSDQNQRPRMDYWGSNIDSGMLNEFLDSIREGREPSVSGRDGHKAVTIVLAAYESARTGQPVALPI